MDISSLSSLHAAQPALDSAGLKAGSLKSASPSKSELREAFDSFVGESFYGQLLGAMRKSVGKPAYFHGGQAEEVFRGQLDQTLAADMSKKNAGDLTGSMFELFTLNRS